ncbi:formate/nitrite transporter family protein [Succinivibrio dextrinosolvens]|jgi:formate/nitrite transporter FocA (FNT family)|uniref:formate/nitrite transporter family protein n=1 Tax=Succinivibrio dextrinosolvens TaxID=83771 RepID=UPI001920F1B6|nr:formate/nitrite transporter family protein [Succinivibrio dextrinosolvens]
MKSLLHIISSSFTAGLCIGIAGLAYLKNPDIIGAVLFGFGLLTVVHYKLKLYTGTAGFFTNKKEFFALLPILLGNILGCAAAAASFRYCMDVTSLSAGIVEKRLSTDILGCIILGIGCGFIMTTAVQFARENKFLPLLFGVPVFIMCGFYHSIADAFYYATWLSMENIARAPDVFVKWAVTVFGNFIGCNLYRILLSKWLTSEDKDKTAKDKLAIDANDSTYKKAS